MDNILKMPTESKKDYKIRLCRNKELYGFVSWNKVAELYYKETGDFVSESTLRRWFSSYREGFDDGVNCGLDNEELIREIQEEHLKIKKEKIKVQTEKIEYNKWLREDARLELFLEKIEQAIKEIEPLKVPDYLLVNENTKKDLIVLLSDIHYGKEVEIRGLRNEILNSYNVNVFEKRMWELFDKVLKICEKESVDHINLFNLSDSIEGILRMNQLQSLQLGIVDSVIGLAEFMANWINEMSKYVLVDYYSVLGNHNEIRPLGSKSGDFPHENTERLIAWHLKHRLRDNKNVVIHENDSNFCFVEILGTNILATHGQNEKDLTASIKDYSMIYQERIDMLLVGHLHSSYSKTVQMGVNNGNFEIIQCPAIVGIDEYSMKLKRTSRPGSKVIVIEDKEGKSCVYDIRLK